MEYVFNPFTGTFDLVNPSPADIVTYTDAAANGLTATPGMYVAVLIDNSGQVVFV